MTKSEFIQAKKSSFVPQFKDLIELKESGKTSHLMDFMTMLHPNTTKQGQGSKGEVFAGDEGYYFTIYTTGILKTTPATFMGKPLTRRFYPFKN